MFHSHHQSLSPEQSMVSQHYNQEKINLAQMPIFLYGIHCWISHVKINQRSQIAKSTKNEALDFKHSSGVLGWSSFYRRCSGTICHEIQLPLILLIVLVKHMEHCIMEFLLLDSSRPFYINPVAPSSKIDNLDVIQVEVSIQVIHRHQEINLQSQYKNGNVSDAKHTNIQGTKGKHRISIRNPCPV